MHIDNEKEEKKEDKKELYKQSAQAFLKHLKINRFNPMHVIKSTYNEFATVKLCSMTIRRYLKNVGVCNYVTAVKPLLSLKNIRERKQ